jgi:hypothetical protein
LNVPRSRAKVRRRVQTITCDDRRRAVEITLKADADFGSGIEGDRWGRIASDFGSTLAVVSSAMGLNGLFDNPAVSK